MSDFDFKLISDDYSESLIEKCIKTNGVEKMKKVDINIMYLSVGLAGITSVALLFMSACYASYQLILFLLR